MAGPHSVTEPASLLTIPAGGEKGALQPVDEAIAVDPLPPPMIPSTTTTGVCTPPAQLTILL